MKFLFAIIAVCLVAVNANTTGQPPLNYINVAEILADIEQTILECVAALKDRIMEAVLDPWQQVQVALESIESLREESEECVAAEDENVTATVNDMHKSITACGSVATKDSLEIIVDIRNITRQLIFDGYELKRLRKICKKISNPIKKQACKARLSVKATLYLKNAGQSIKTIKQIIIVRVPAVKAEAESCTHNATDAAILELNNILDTVINCIGSEY